MMKTFLQVLIFLLTLASCSKKAVNDYPFTTIHIPELKGNDKYIPLDYTDCFSKIELVALETNDNSILPLVNQLEFSNNKLYFYNYRSAYIKIFDIEGNYLYTFNRLGNGPAEYNNIKGFDVDDHNKIHVLSYKKISVYDSLYQFKDKIKIKDLGGARHICKMDKDKYLLIYNYQHEEKGVNRLAIFSSGKNKYNYFSENKFKTTVFDYISNDYNGQIIIAPPIYDYNAYTLNEDKFRCKYYFDFGNLSITEKEISEEKSRIMKGSRQVERLDFKDAAMSVNNIWDTPRYVFFNYKINRVIHNAIYNKKTKTVHSSKYFHRLAKDGPRIRFKAYNFEENYLIGFIYPHQIKPMEESSLLNLDQIDFLNSVDRNSNPILVKYYLK